MPVTLIGESVFARCLSSLKEERVEASKVLKGPSKTKYEGDKKQFVEHIRKVNKNNLLYNTDFLI
jgi:6-phosphogluconate dehydrogenase